MRLQDCILDVDVAVSAPLVRTAPDDAWVSAKEGRIIPESLFRLYCLANYFSIDKAPLYFSDRDHVLFHYLESVIRGVFENLSESHALEQEMLVLKDKGYTLKKRSHGASWDKDADSKRRRLFKLFILNVSASLDGLSEVAAIFFTGEISKELRVGKADFSKIKKWLKSAYAEPAGIVAPQKHYAGLLYQKLRPSVFTEGPEADWIDVLNLYRDKIAHLGSYMFSKITFHDKTGNFYTYSPRQWPFILQQYMSLNGGTESTLSFRDICEEMLIWQDMPAFSKGLRLKVLSLLEAGFSVIAASYQNLAVLPFNKRALDELDKNCRHYDFKHFDDSRKEDS